jgi:hypothetical protein
MQGSGMSDSGCVTIEWSVGFVRAHDEPAVFGEYAPFKDAFAVVQVEPGIFEAKIAHGLTLTIPQRRSLHQQMVAAGAKAVFYWRYKPGRAPYKVWITK